MLSAMKKLETEIKDIIMSKYHKISVCDFFLSVYQLPWRQKPPKTFQKNSSELVFLKNPLLLCLSFERLIIPSDGTKRRESEKMPFHSIWWTKQPSFQSILPTVQSTSSFAVGCTSFPKSRHK